MPVVDAAPTRTGIDRPVAGASAAANLRATSADAASVQMTVAADSVNAPRPTVRLSGCGTIEITGSGAGDACCATPVVGLTRTAASASAAMCAVT